MTDQEASEMLVLRDVEGNFYLLPRQTVEDARVADASVALVQAALRGAAARDDTGGYLMTPPQHAGRGAQSFIPQEPVFALNYTRLNLAGINFQRTLQR